MADLVYMLSDESPLGDQNVNDRHFDGEEMKVLQWI